jgi:hypothetical protein
MADIRMRPTRFPEMESIVLEVQLMQWLPILLIKPGVALGNEYYFELPNWGISQN